MKKILILLVYFLPLCSFSQYIYSPNTIYMVPPTSGCNGQWALMDSLTCQFPTYNITPFGCATNMTKIGDTLFVDLCSIPCNIYVNGDTGNTCLTATVALQVTTNINKEKKIYSEKLFPNPNFGAFKIEYSTQKNQTLFITDLMGKIVHQEILFPENKEQNIIANKLRKGLYFVMIKNEKGQTVFIERINVID